VLYFYVFYLFRLNSVLLEADFYPFYHVDALYYTSMVIYYARSYDYYGGGLCIKPFLFWVWAVMLFSFTLGMYCSIADKFVWLALYESHGPNLVYKMFPK
jgi:hypothetical protein